jgi:hypothetical protein
MIFHPDPRMATKVVRFLVTAILAATLAEAPAVARELTKNERITIEEGVSWQLHNPRHGQFRWLPHAGISAAGSGVSGEYYCGYVGDVPFQVLVVRDGTGNIKVTAVGPLGEDPASISDTIAECRSHGFPEMQAP